MLDVQSLKLMLAVLVEVDQATQENVFSKPMTSRSLIPIGATPLSVMGARRSYSPRVSLDLRAVSIAEEAVRKFIARVIKISYLR